MFIDVSGRLRFTTNSKIFQPFLCWRGMMDIIAEKDQLLSSTTDSAEYRLFARTLPESQNLFIFALHLYCVALYIVFITPRTVEKVIHKYN